MGSAWLQSPLGQENLHLRSQIESLTERNATQAAQVHRLSDQNATQAVEIHKFRQEKAQMDAEILRLRNENSGLRTQLERQLFGNNTTANQTNPASTPYAPYGRSVSAAATMLQTPPSNRPSRSTAPATYHRARFTLPALPLAPPPALEFTPATPTFPPELHPVEQKIHQLFGLVANFAGNHGHENLDMLGGPLKSACIEAVGSKEYLTLLKTTPARQPYLTSLVTRWIWKECEASKLIPTLEGDWHARHHMLQMKMKEANAPMIKLLQQKAELFQELISSPYFKQWHAARVEEQPGNPPKGMASNLMVLLLPLINRNPNKLNAAYAALKAIVFEAIDVCFAMEAVPKTWQWGFTSNGDAFDRESMESRNDTRSRLLPTVQIGATPTVYYTNHKENGGMTPMILIRGGVYRRVDEGSRG